MRGTCKKIVLISLLAVVIFASLMLFTACQSTDKTESFFNTSGIANAKFNYNSDNNKTEVVWATYLNNDTIYNISGFSVKFKLYNGSNLIDTRVYNYDRNLKHGDEYTGSFQFYADSEINRIEFVSWNANYVSFWNTYKIWIIITCAIAGVALIAYLIFMIVTDFELSEIADFFEEHGWIAICLIAPLGGAIWGFASSNWVPTLIVIGGVVVFVLVALLGHLIKYTVENKELIKLNANLDEDEVEEIDECLNDISALSKFTVEELKGYCRVNGIKGFSSLNKVGIVNLIYNFGQNSEIVSTKTNSKVDESKSIKKIMFSDIAGLDEAKNAFKEKVVFAFEHKELYEKYGKKVGGGLLLYGLPGTGKTMFAEAASNETDALFIPIKCSDIKSKWYGESEERVKKIFAKARKAKKAIIFFDEFEAIGAKRTSNADNGNNDLVPQILAEMQGIGSNQSDNIIMVIAATNKPWAIDSAFLRPGRFDDKIYIPLPDYEARKQLFKLKLCDVPQQELDYDYLSNITEGFNGADIGEFCDKLKMSAINKSIESKIESPITMFDVNVIKNSINSSVSKEDMEELMEFKKTYK